MADTNWNLDKNQYRQIVNQLKAGATVSVNIGSLSVPWIVVTNAVISDGYAYMMTDDGVLYRYDEKFDFPDIIAKSEYNKPENVASRQIRQAEQDKETERQTEAREWFLGHPSA
jgi:hypothetical protein